MKIYVTARFKDADRTSIEAICLALRAAGLQDFVFIRDLENYSAVFADHLELWRRAKQEIEKCDGLLIDISDKPTGGRVLEAGIAYGLGLPVIVIAKSGVKYKNIYDGIAAKVIEYEEYTDLVVPLKEFAK